MKRIGACLAFTLAGVGIGWYLGYTRPVAKNQRALLAQYHYVRDSFHMTDEGMAEIGPSVSEYFAASKRQDEFAAAVALNAIANMERGETEKAKTNLGYAVRNYYQVYGTNGGDTNLLAHIEKVARTSSFLAHMITNRSE